jgi:hypothetical protein
MKIIIKFSSSVSPAVTDVGQMFLNLMFMQINGKYETIYFITLKDPP